MSVLSNKTIFVCQGPMVSVGLSGSGSWVSYEVFENVLELHSQVRGFQNCDFLLVAWCGELTDNQKDICEKKDLKFMEVEPFSVLQSNKYIKPNMKKNFFHAMKSAHLSGALEGYDYIVKLRVDQCFDLSAWLEPDLFVHDEVISVLGIDTMMPDSLLDFSFKAKLPFFASYIKRLCFERELNPSVHFDMFYKLDPVNNVSGVFSYFRWLLFFLFQDRREKCLKILGKISTPKNFDFEKLRWRGDVWSPGTRYISKNKFFSSNKQLIEFPPCKDALPLKRHFRIISVALTHIGCRIRLGNWKIWNS